MPLMRYFVYVGGALLALLLIVNACLPALPVTEARSTNTPNLSVIRIHSDRKLPDRVVFDTSRPIVSPDPVPAPVMAQAAPAPPRAATPPLKTEVREAFAQANLHAEPKRKRKSVARNYAGPPRIRVAQQPTMFLFGNNPWR